ncbi:hypothetical protein CVT25_001463 [Psilocybe cyanescens]|uniref:Uncharacterized protein n=1 Tax=Psilocybe cyanescens TaxID=93625 RepID=A0A409WNV1_PSICY|nr:hypothetical protein CVT25_001463 [Psilocybe cyanescens]
MVSSLRRSKIMVLLPSSASAEPSSSASNSHMMPHQYLILQHYREQCLKRKALLRAARQITPAPIVTTPSPTPMQSHPSLRRTSSSTSLLFPLSQTPLPFILHRPQALCTGHPPSASCPITQHHTYRLTSP